MKKLLEITLEEKTGQANSKKILAEMGKWSLSVMTSIAQIIKASVYACTGRYPVEASAMFLNEFLISLSKLEGLV